MDELLRLAEASGVKGLTLKLTSRGIVENDKPPLPWSEVVSCDINRYDNQIADVNGRESKPLIRFSLYNAPNSWLALRAIQLMVELKKKEGPRPRVKQVSTEADPSRHEETAHYQNWRDTVAEMIAEPRSSVKYENVFPGDEGWG